MKNVVYTAAKIRNLIESLSLVYNIPQINWMLTYGTAMCVHGLVPNSGDIDITLATDDFNRVAEYIKPKHDETGPVIWMPGKVEIRPLSTLPSEHWFETVNHCRVATLESLLGAYQYLVDHPLPNRFKDGEDAQKIKQLTLEINRRGEKFNADLARDLTLAAEAVMDTGICFDLSQIWNKLDEPRVVFVKDASNRKWDFTFDPTDMSVSFYPRDEVDMHSMVEKHKLVYSKTKERV